ncbi:MAG: hypothetical protein DRJ52_10975, partial [Thermoprotei archaeon]
MRREIQLIEVAVAVVSSIIFMQLLSVFKFLDALIYIACNMLLFIISFPATYIKIIFSLYRLIIVLILLALTLRKIFSNGKCASIALACWILYIFVVIGSSKLFSFIEGMLQLPVEEYYYKLLSREEILSIGIALVLLYTIAVFSENTYEVVNNLENKGAEILFSRKILLLGLCIIIATGLVAASALNLQMFFKFTHLENELCVISAVLTLIIIGLVMYVISEKPKVLAYLQ